jgi:hypothetical protein
MDTLPLEMIGAIFDFLDDRSWLRLRLSCKLFCGIPKDRHLRRKKTRETCEKDFRVSDPVWATLYMSAVEKMKTANVQTVSSIYLFDFRRINIYFLFCRTNSVRDLIFV